MAILERLPTSQAEKPSLRQRLKNRLGMRGMRAAEVKPPINSLNELAFAISQAEISPDDDTIEMVLQLDEFAEQVKNGLELRERETHKGDVSQADFLRIARAWDAVRSTDVKPETYGNVNDLMEDAILRVGSLAASATYLSAHNRAKLNGTPFDQELDNINERLRSREKELVTVN